MEAIRNPTGPGVTDISATPVVLYDGLCGLCDRFVQLVLRHDKRRAFRFAPLQGAFAEQALARHGFRPSDISQSPSSVVLLESPGTAFERVRVRSDAVLAVFHGLGGPWRLLGALRGIPRPLRDAVYRLVALVRYRIFGTLESCAVPSSAGEGRFLS